MQTKGIVIAGLAGGSGKSVASVGLTAYLARKGMNVVPFKKGPDYIDAGWMALAAGTKCYNLDPYLMSDETIRSAFLKYSQGADMVVVEGNRGLYDGVNASGGYSTAELAISLRLPVILVVNCTKTTRTVAAMVLGCKNLDERIDIRGVILNHIATKRQSDLISEAVKETTGIPVLGVIPRLKRDIFPMRHLGVVPYQEYSGSAEALEFLAEIFRDSVDTDAVEGIMADIPMQEKPLEPVLKENEETDVLRIGVIQDAAFQFYYAENLEALQKEGAQLIPINALTDTGLPELDGLYIGGGFPETSARELAANNAFRRSLYQAVEEGLPVYAECGGLIYLGESIEIDDQEYELTGVFPVRFGMSTRPQAHGYSIFTVEKDNPYYRLGTIVKGHEFRYSTILEWRGKEADLVLKMKRGQGFADGRDGLQYKNVLALYTHVHVGGTPEWASGFIDCCRNWAKRK
ncbi:MAG: hydrogenobyrinic acid a,c-diamide synthase (glutamine-hydrolyzing) [Desulfocapsaceae bacterium]|nr:hydrogenobyrinic acid a,c-diamide synthase (glutamine-hydrolyzing) [Desulfocapsaceae bacterium]